MSVCVGGRVCVRRVCECVWGEGVCVSVSVSVSVWGGGGGGGSVCVIITSNTHHIMLKRMIPFPKCPADEISILHPVLPTKTQTVHVMKSHHFLTLPTKINSY